MPSVKPPAAAAAQVFAWIVEGSRLEDIEEALAQEYPQLTAPQAANLIKLANIRIDELAASGHPSKAWCLAAYQEVYRRAIESGELGVAIRAVNHIQKFRLPRQP